MDRIKDYTANFNDAKIFTSSPAMIPGYGATNGFEMYIQDRKGGDIEDLAAVTNEFLAELNQRPEIGSAHTSFNPRFPQYQLDVDASEVQACRHISKGGAVGAERLLRRSVVRPSSTGSPNSIR